MILFSDKYGNITQIITETVYKYSNNASTVVLISPIDATQNTVSMAAILPGNKISTQWTDMSYMQLSGATDINNEQLYVYYIGLSSIYTDYEGIEGIQFRAVNNSTGAILNIFMHQFRVEPGVTPLDNAPTSEEYSNILNYLSQIESVLITVEETIQDADTTNSENSAELENISSTLNTVSSELPSLTEAISQLSEQVSGIRAVQLSPTEYAIYVGDTVAGTITYEEYQYLTNVTYNENTGILTFTFTSPSGQSVSTVDLSALVDVYSAGSGLQLNNKEFSVSISTQNKNRLLVSDAGLLVLPDANQTPVYSVTFSGASPTGTRGDDAVGMVANVAVGSETVRNDFDAVPFFDRPICNCSFNSETGSWEVTACKGEPGFSWYADYVMYECTPFYYKANFDTSGSPTYVSVCGSPISGYALAPLFKNDTDKVYCPCFNISFSGSQPLSSADRIPYTGSMNYMMNTVQAYNGDMCLETIEGYFSDCLLLWVEFATKDWKSIMPGASSLYNSYTATEYNTITAISPSDEAWIEFQAYSDGLCPYVVGQNINIGTTPGASDVESYIEITKIDTGDPDSSYGTYRLYFNDRYPQIAIDNYISSAAFKTGVAAMAVTNASSGMANVSTSPTVGFPCIWRGKENPWGNVFSSICNVLIEKSYDNPTVLKYLSNPSLYSSGNVTSDYIESNVIIYGGDGPAKTISVDSTYPFLFSVSEVGTSYSQYLCTLYDNQYSEGTVRMAVGGYFSSNYTGLYIDYNTSPNGENPNMSGRLYLKGV